MSLLNGGSSAAVEKHSVANVDSTTQLPGELELFRALTSGGFRIVNVHQSGVLMLPDVNGNPLRAFPFIKYTLDGQMTISDESLPENTWVNEQQLKGAERQNLALPRINWLMRQGFLLTELENGKLVHYFFLRIAQKYIVGDFVQLSKAFNDIASIGNPQADKLKMALLGQISTMLFAYGMIKDAHIESLTAKSDVEQPEGVIPFEQQEAGWFNRIRREMRTQIGLRIVRDLKTRGIESGKFETETKSRLEDTDNHWAWLEPGKPLVVPRPKAAREIIFGTSPLQLLEHKQDPSNILMITPDHPAFAELHGSFKIDAEGDVFFKPGQDETATCEIDKTAPQDISRFIVMHDGKTIHVVVKVLVDKIEVSIISES